MFDQMTMTYTNAIKSYRQKAEHDLNSLRASFEKYVIQNKVTEEIETPKILKAAGFEEFEKTNDQSYNENTEENDDFDTGSSRMLLVASDCKNGGKFTTARVNMYICDGSTVTKAQYDQKNGEGCSISESTENVCYCSFEYYGDTCTSLNTYTCDIERINYPVQCEGQDSFQYVYSYDGIPPCYTIENGETITMTNRLVCRFTNTEYAFEGVKPTKYQVITQPDLGSNVFTYAVDGENFKLRNMPNNLRQQLNFINWRRITKPYMIETPLTALNFAGSDTFDTTITFDTDLTSLAHIGRYYYELAVLRNISVNASTNVTGNYFGGYFEQAGFVEPPPGKESSNTLLIVLLVLGAALVIGAIIGYHLYQRKKMSSRFGLATETQPLFEAQ